MLAAAAVAAPAIVLTSAVPARATSANSTLELTLSATGIGTGAPVDATATVLDSRGDPWAGQVVTFAVSDSSALTLGAVSAVTDSAGRATVSVSAASNATAGTRSITATSGPLSTSAALDVIAITATASTGTNPWSLAMSPLGDVAVAGHYNVGTVSVISTTTDSTIAAISVADSLGVTVSGDGSYALACSSVGGIYRINLSTNTIAATIPISPGYPYAASISPDQKYAYVTTWLVGLSRVNLLTNTVSATIPFSETSDVAPTSVCIAPNGTFAYAVSNGKLRRIDTSSNAITATIEITKAYGVTFSSDGSFAYVSARDGFVHRVDPSSDQIVASIPTPGDTVGIDISTDGSFAYCAHPEANLVSRIDTATNTITASVPVSGRPLFVAISPDDSFAYVTRNTATSVARLVW